MRKKIVAGNWKMNTDIYTGLSLAGALNTAVKNADIKADTGIIIAPPFVHLKSVNDIIDTDRICLAAQNCSDQKSGAFTGEVSAEMLKSIGVKAVILGHSERRAIYGESDAVIAAKVKIVLENEMKAIFCCGETLEERNGGKHFDVIRTQVENGIFDFSASDMSNIIIAYEPVWAIGTGVTASKEQAQEMHAYIRKLLTDKYGFDVAQDVTILYGGSVKPANATELFAQPDVDGGLVGGASLDAAGFTEIIKAR